MLQRDSNLTRILLQTKHPEKWHDLMQLQDWTELNCKPRDFTDLDKFRRDVLGLPDETSAALWNKILGIFNVNSFSFMMKCETEDRSPSFAEFVYLTTSLFSHSCASNANWAIGCSPDFQMQVRTTVDIKQGEMISVPYTYDHMNFGTYGRVIRQQSFNCKCNRCLDPTELGTYNSVIKCYKCQQGLVLPLNPVDVKSEWKCKHCLSVFPGDLVMLFVEALADEVENCDSVEDLETFILMHRDKTLHPNHWVLNLASNSILSQQAHCLHTLSREQLERFLWHCYYVLEILNVLAPGSSLFRGNVLLLISRSLLTKTELSIREGHLTDQALIVEQMKLVYSYQKAAFHFWADDHSYRPQNETYGPEAKDLLKEMSRVKNQYLSEIQDL
ncbi:Protein msta, isoform A [Orchesella cincta]|uniref:Protein msta, isoform A n=1 Tax=Orchesella cincta TaxID=48709 RepID=A0A1D2M277_ORCCI|nr:Protein msta, isoform A [Orchesella cincta]